MKFKIIILCIIAVVYHSSSQTGKKFSTKSRLKTYPDNKNAVLKVEDKHYYKSRHLLYYQEYSDNERETEAPINPPPPSPTPPTDPPHPPTDPTDPFNNGSISGSSDCPTTNATPTTLNTSKQPYNHITKLTPTTPESKTSTTTTQGSSSYSTVLNTEPSSTKDVTSTFSSKTEVNEDDTLRKDKDSWDKVKDSDVNSSFVMEQIEKLKKYIDKKNMKSHENLIDTTTILGKLQSHTKSINKVEMSNFTDNMAEICNDVVDHEEAWQDFNDTNKKSEIGSRILEFIQATGFSLGCNKNITNTTKIVKPNIAIETYSIDSKSTMKIHMNGSVSGIILPKGIPQPDPDTGCDRGTAVGVIISKLKDYLGSHLQSHQQINSHIIAFSIQNSLNSTQLPDGISPVRIVLKHNNPLKWGDTIQCVYWDFNQRNWSTNGCRFVQMLSNRRLSVCECTHLTNFAALMDVSGRETDSKVKDILTKVFCGLSIVCLILTIGFLTLVRVLRNRRNNITSNLCFCLLVVNLLVVFGMDSTLNNILCQTVAIFLLYFILCSFSWMVMEGYHLYQMIVLVFSNVGHIKLIYLYGISYGVPLMITIASLLIIGFKNILRTDSYFCWISSPSYPHRVWAVAGPASVAILVNCLFLFLALKEAYSAKIRKKQIYSVDIHDSTVKMMAEKLSQIFTRIQGFSSLLLLLGIPWISFILYIHRFGASFSYVFITINGLQGVFIFIFQILLNEKVRTVVRKYYQRNISSQSLFSTSKTSSTANSERSHSAHDSIKL